MKTKLVITTFAFMLLITLFGYVILVEPGRMGKLVVASEASQIEQGAMIYQQQCQNCHGQHAKAELCFDTHGSQIACKGLALNNPALLCGEPSLRLAQMRWDGTVEEYVRGAITGSRVAAGMPAFGESFGGPLNDAEVEYVTRFIFNFLTSDGMMSCGYPFQPPLYWPVLARELPAGDAAAGEGLYQITYGCSACHGDPEIDGSNVIGPWAGNFKNISITKKDVTYTAADYFYESVLLPSKFISPNCPTGPCSGPPSGMPDNFGLRMTFQDLADVMAYLEIDPKTSSDIEIIYPANLGIPSKGFGLCGC